MENIYSYVAENVKRVQNEIAEACIKYGRDPKEVILMGVSKTQPIEKLEVAYSELLTANNELQKDIERKEKIDDIFSCYQVFDSFGITKGYNVHPFSAFHNWNVEELRCKLLNLL